MDRNLDDLKKLLISTSLELESAREEIQMQRRIHESKIRQLEELLDIARLELDQARREKLQLQQTLNQKFALDSQNFALDSQKFALDSSPKFALDSSPKFALDSVSSTGLLNAQMGLMQEPSVSVPVNDPAQERMNLSPEHMKMPDSIREHLGLELNPQCELPLQEDQQSEVGTLSISMAMEHNISVMDSMLQSVCSPMILPASSFSSDSSLSPVSCCFEGAYLLEPKSSPCFEINPPNMNAEASTTCGYGSAVVPVDQNSNMGYASPISSPNLGIQHGSPIVPVDQNLNMGYRSPISSPNLSIQNQNTNLGMCLEQNQYGSSPVSALDQAISHQNANLHESTNLGISNQSTNLGISGMMEQNQSMGLHRQMHLPEPPEADMQVMLKSLPEKGKLLQAVMQAGPLLQTLLLAGPLPQWRHPPPPLNSGEIPQISIAAANSAPSSAFSHGLDRSTSNFQRPFRIPQMNMFHDFRPPKYAKIY